MIDYYENPVAKPFCDHHIIQSTLNEDAVREIIKSIKPDLVITCCTDQALLIVAKIAEEFNLYFPISFTQAMNLTNKKWMKKRLNQYSIPTAKSIVIKECIPRNIIDKLTLPVIFKPVDSNSSKGVVKINNISDLNKGYEYSKNFSRSGEVVCEEFIEGTEVSIDAYVRNGKAIYLMASTLEKLESEEGNFPICRCKSPAQISNIIRSKIERLLQQVADAFKLSNCPLILQAIIHGDEVSVIELSARTGVVRNIIYYNI
jgi:carbamoylphosphate synthase large subunit